MPDISVGSAIFLLTFAVTGLLLLTFIALICLSPALVARFAMGHQYTIRDAVLFYLFPTALVGCALILDDWYTFLFAMLFAISLPAIYEYHVKKASAKKVGLHISIILIGFVSIAYAILVFSALIGDDPQRLAAHRYLLFAEFIFIVILLNAILLAIPIAVGSRTTITVTFLAVPPLILFAFNPFFIPNRVMAIYGIGNFTAESLVLAEAGCATARYHGLKMADSADEKTCALSNAKILSRLGSTIYIEAAGNDGKSVRFTISAQNVLSYSRQR